MSTWHQQQNPTALAALWAPTDKWKCVSDKPGLPAGCMSFDDEADARRYCARTGDVLIPPKG